MNTCDPSSLSQQWLFERTNSTVLDHFNQGANWGPAASTENSWRRQTAAADEMEFLHLLQFLIYLPLRWQLPLFGGEAGWDTCRGSWLNTSVRGETDLWWMGVCFKVTVCVRCICSVIASLWRTVRLASLIFLLISYLTLLSSLFLFLLSPLKFIYCLSFSLYPRSPFLSPSCLSCFASPCTSVSICLHDCIFAHLLHSPSQIPLCLSSSDILPGGRRGERSYWAKVILTPGWSQAEPLWKSTGELILLYNPHPPRVHSLVSPAPPQHVVPPGPLSVSLLWM